jgi:hypothetical protein
MTCPYVPAPGEPKMDWDCGRQGCFNEKKRMKFGALKAGLPGKISFSDVDGMTEIDGHFLLVEVKANRGERDGQQLMFERLTKLSPKIRVIFAVGDCYAMEFSEYCVMDDGKFGDWLPTSREGLVEVIAKWSDSIRPYWRRDWRDGPLGHALGHAPQAITSA